VLKERLHLPAGAPSSGFCSTQKPCCGPLFLACGRAWRAVAHNERAVQRTLQIQLRHARANGRAGIDGPLNPPVVTWLVAGHLIPAVMWRRVIVSPVITWLVAGPLIPVVMWRRVVVLARACATPLVLPEGPFCGVRDSACAARKVPC
jgi:hypothetical protein